MARYAINIDWDADDEDIKDPELPIEVLIPDNVSNDDVTDYFAEEYYWCVKGLDIVNR